MVALRPLDPQTLRPLDPLTESKKAEKIQKPLFKKLRQTSQETFESEPESTKSWDVCLNSPKSGGGFFSTTNFFLTKNFKFHHFFLFGSRKMKCRGSSETRFGQVSAQSEPSSGGKRTFKVCKHFEQNLIEKWNVGDRLKRVLAKFEADRSQVWGVNGRSKFVGDDVGPFSVPYKV